MSNPVARRPVIGVTIDGGDKPGRRQIQINYLRAIELAGGLPWPIGFGLSDKTTELLLEQMDGLLLSGGDDLHPALFNQPLHPQTHLISKQRQDFELDLFDRAASRDMPILGVCLGLQLINVARGGSLIQFLPDHDRASAVEHRAVNGVDSCHGLELHGQSVLGRRLGAQEVQVNSSHKQAADRIGKNLQAVGWSQDQVIEAVEDPAKRFLLAVQWHPERMLDQPRQRDCFALLVEAARGFRV